MVYRMCLFFTEHIPNVYECNAIQLALMSQLNEWWRIDVRQHGVFADIPDAVGAISEGIHQCGFPVKGVFWYHDSFTGYIATRNQEHLGHYASFVYAAGKKYTKYLALANEANHKLPGVYIPARVIRMPSDYLDVMEGLNP